MVLVVFVGSGRIHVVPPPDTPTDNRPTAQPPTRTRPAKSVPSPTQTRLTLSILFEDQLPLVRIILVLSPSPVLSSLLSAGYRVGKSKTNFSFSLEISIRAYIATISHARVKARNSLLACCSIDRVSSESIDKYQSTMKANVLPE